MLLTVSAALALAPAMPQQITHVRRAGLATSRPFVFAPLLDESAAPPLPFDPALFGRGAAATDVDGDSRLDFVISTGTGAVVYRNRGPAGFEDVTATALPAGLSGTSKPIFGDVDGDGDDDLVLLASAPPDPDVLLRRVGPSGFGPAEPLPTASTVTSDAELVDVDGDGDLDLVRSIGASGHANAGGRDTLLINDGSGTFVPDPVFSAAAWNDPAVPSTGVVSLDANGDGRVDLFITKADSGAVTGSPGARNVLLLGTGGGVFNDGSADLPVLEDMSFDAVATDLDGDGDDDLIVANSVLSVSGANSGDVLVNQGGAQGGQLGVFLDRAGALEEAPSLAESIRLGPVAADVDLDGRLDLLIRVHDLPPGGEQPLFLGSGLDFRRSTRLRTGTLICAGAVFADIDGDGDPDLLITSAGSAAGGTSLGSARLFVNTTR